jgi:hypothetical protein
VSRIQDICGQIVKNNVWSGDKEFFSKLILMKM